MQGVFLAHTFKSGLNTARWYFMIYLCHNCSTLIPKVCQLPRPHLRVEISVVYVLVVEIDHSSADITAQFDLLSPAEVDFMPGQQLLQTASAHILGGGGNDEVIKHFELWFIQWKCSSILQHVKSGKLFLCIKLYTLDTLEKHNGESLLVSWDFLGRTLRRQKTGYAELWILIPKSCHPPQESDTAGSP